MTSTIRIGISSCLLGEGVRFDGGHKKDSFLTGTFGRFVVKSGRGIFAAKLLDRFPSLPVEEEGRLSDPRLRENFVERVFAYSRLRELFRSKWTVGALVAFHTAHKLILMAHSPDAYRSLGRLVARARGVPAKDMERRYTEAFMAALTIIATPRRHTNVLQHMVGYFKNRLDAAAKAELLASIEDYRSTLVPLIVPLTLLRHHVRVHDVSYLAGQLYLQPHPKEATPRCWPISAGFRMACNLPLNRRCYYWAERNGPCWLKKWRTLRTWQRARSSLVSF